MFRHLLFTAALPASLCACQSSSDSPVEPTGVASEAVDPPMTSPAAIGSVAPVPTPTQTTGTPVAVDECGAGKLGRWLNLLPTETIKADIAATVGQRPIRYYRQGDPITMDFSAARLNVELGADGRIKLFRCG